MAENKVWKAYITLEMPLDIIAEDNETIEDLMAWVNTTDGKMIIRELIRKSQHGGRDWDTITVDMDGQTEPVEVG